MNKKPEYKLIVPFSESFYPLWDLWKEYKWASHQFKYKSVFSEQAALEQLVTLSKGDEETAVKIIKQSMRREWQGLFPLHETTTGNNGKSKQSTGSKTGTDKSNVVDMRQRVSSAFDKRYGTGGQASSEPNTKAV